MRTIEKKTLTGSGATVYSDVFSPAPSTHFVVVTGQRTSGSGSAIVTLEAGWDPNSSSANDWVDLGLSLSLSTAALTIASGDGPLNEARVITGYYRIKAVITGTATIDVFAHFTEG